MSGGQAIGATEQALREFVRTEIAYDRQLGEIDPDRPLLGDVLDSTDVLRLVVFIEERFGVRIDDDELEPDNFETLRRLAAFVDRKAAR